MFKMNQLVVGLFLFLSSLFSCQQKGDFKTVNVEDFDSIIQDEEVQRLVRFGRGFGVVERQQGAWHEVAALDRRHVELAGRVRPVHHGEVVLVIGPSPLGPVAPDL